MRLKLDMKPLIGDDRLQILHAIMEKLLKYKSVSGIKWNIRYAKCLNMHVDSFIQCLPG